MRWRAAFAHVPHADLWAFVAFFFLSRMNWIVSLHYHGSEIASGSIYISLAASLLLVVLAYALALLVSPRAFALISRALVLGMAMFLLGVTYRHLVSGPALSGSWLAVIVCGWLAVTGLGAVFLAPVWSRLRAALLAVALIGAVSPSILVALLAPRVELFAEPGKPHRPVIILVLDEFSAGSAHPLAKELGGRQLRVGAWSVPSIGKNTIDVIPALLTGAEFPDARACTFSAVCGRGGAVDLAQITVARDDVDVVGFHHPYCRIGGLRYCATTSDTNERPLINQFLCTFPMRRLFNEKLGCRRMPAAATQRDRFAEAEGRIQDAPFWTQGGILFAHVPIPHPPGLGGELTLADAYASNLVRAERFVLGLVDHLDRSAFRDDYTLIVTSDHALRSNLWCVTAPFSTHGCEVPNSMRTPEVPFIVASRGPAVAYRVPRSNVDLLPVVAELSAKR